MMKPKVVECFKKNKLYHFRLSLFVLAKEKPEVYTSGFLII